MALKTITQETQKLLKNLQSPKNVGKFKKKIFEHKGLSHRGVFPSTHHQKPRSKRKSNRLGSIDVIPEYRTDQSITTLRSDFSRKEEEEDEVKPNRDLPGTLAKAKQERCSCS